LISKTKFCASVGRCTHICDLAGRTGESKRPFRATLILVGYTFSAEMLMRDEVLRSHGRRATTGRWSESTGNVQSVATIRVESDRLPPLPFAHCLQAATRPGCPCNSRNIWIYASACRPDSSIASPGICSVGDRSTLLLAGQHYWQMPPVPTPSPPMPFGMNPRTAT